MHRNKIWENNNLKNMKGMRFKMAYDVVSLTVLFEISQNLLIFFKMFLTLSINYQHEYASGSKYVLMNIGLE